MESHDAVVIGAGFAGLGAAAALRARGVRRFVVVEQGEGVGHFWTQTYDRLHLHSAFHDLPNDGGLRARYPTFLSRREVVAYFRDYAQRHELAEHFRFGTRVGRVKRVDPGENDGHEWDLDTSKGRVQARYSRFGIRKPVDGPMDETFRKGRIPTFDQGAIPLIKRGAIRVIDGNVRPLFAFEEQGVRLGEEVAPFDAVIFATGFEPRLEEFIADPELLGAVRWAPLLPLTDGRTRSRVHPSIFFPGFDVSPLGGVSLGRFGWEAGERIACALGVEAPRP